MTNFVFRLNEHRKDSAAAATDKYTLAKRDYAEKRGVVWSPKNKHHGKLKTSLKHFEDELKSKKVVFCEWSDQKTFQLMLSNGLLIYVEINVFTGDINRINFDKYFVGKIISENICDGKVELCWWNDRNSKLRNHFSDHHTTTHPDIVQREPDHLCASPETVAEEFRTENLGS